MRAYRLLRQARKNISYCPSHNTFWGKRILHFERENHEQYRAMQQAARSLGMILEGGKIRYGGK